MTSSNFISILGYIVGVVGAVTVIFSKVKNENIKDLRERVEILEKEREDARTKHIENEKAISNLEGKLESYKEIPLKSIASSLEALPKIVDSNAQILETLKGSATVLASGTRTRARAVKKVMTDLEHSQE
jgi:chromosome segregation ATPase